MATKDDTDASGIVTTPVRHGSAYEEYLYGRSIISPYQVKNNWSSSTQGRMAIRLVSRGIFGAAAFAFAGRYATKQLRNFEPDTFKWGEVSVTEKPLQYVAKSFDVIFGKPIKGFVRFFAPEKQREAWAFNALRFRPKYYFHSVPGMSSGRSLGAEMVAVTFDFSAMSLADALARNTIQAFDPNLPQPWFVDKDGHAATRAHGKFDAKKWGQAVVRATWRSVSKNAGEDWFAALPYVYQMKWQREALAKIPSFVQSDKDRADGKKGKLFDGFKVSWDRNRNGGSLIVNTDGQIVGDYQLAGILDLQGRFVGYNVYTLMYRELYDTIGRGLWGIYKHGIHVSDFHLPKKSPIDMTTDAVGASVRYLIKSTIKAHLFMNPAVPFFWLFRVPQSKWRSEIILQGGEPGQSVIGTWNPTGPGVEDQFRKGVHRFNYPLTYDDWVRPERGLTGKERPDFLYFGNQKVPFPKKLKEKGVYSLENCPTLTSKLLNPFGWISYQTGSLMSRAASNLAPTGSKFSQFLADIKLPDGVTGAAREKILNNIALERTVLMRTWGDAAWSYTPYFIAKDEFGLRVNDTPATGEMGHMDKAIYGLIDNVFTFRFKKAGHSIKDIWHLSTEDLNKEKVVHYEGKKIAKDDDEPTAPAIAQAPLSTPNGPSTKVQATTVQYNAPPPTHLQHSNNSTMQPKRRDEPAHGSESMTERLQQMRDSQQSPTVH